MRAVIIAVAIWGCAVAPHPSHLRPELNRDRVATPRANPIPTYPEFNLQAISHPSGGWPVSYLLSDSGAVRMSDLTWKLQIVMNGVIDLQEYPRITNKMLDVAIFRTRNRYECLTQTFVGVALNPGTAAEFVLDTTLFADGDSFIIEHYRGYSVYLRAYRDGVEVPLNGGAGLMAGPLPYNPQRMQPLTALVGCD